MILGHWQIRKEKKYYLFGMGTDFSKLKYPFIWYDILHVVDVLSRFPFVHADPRFQEMVETDKDPWDIAQELNLIQKSDAGELETIVDKVLAANPNAVADVTTGGKKSKKARGFLLGQVMQKSKGQANPKVVSEILTKKLV